MKKERVLAYQKRGDARVEVFLARDAYAALEQLCARHRLNKRQVFERLLLGERLAVNLDPIAVREGLSEAEAEAMRALEK